MTNEEKEKIRLLKEEVGQDFFGEKPKKSNKIKPEKVDEKGDEIKKEIDEVGGEMSTLNDIMLSRNQDKRMAQLKKVNQARMAYNDPRYSEIFEMLDSNIEDIEEDIYTSKKVWEIAFKYGVKNYELALWMRGSVHVERIRLCYLLSADYKMDLSTQTLQDGINDKGLEIQYAGLIRELSLAYSRQAGFLNQGKFGKKPDIISLDKPIQQITDEQMRNIIEEFRDMKTKEMNGFTSYKELPSAEFSTSIIQPTQNQEDIDSEMEQIIKEGKQNKDESEDFSLSDI